MVSIPEEQFERIKAFVGYGNPNGRYWYVGMEEGLERGGDLAREIRIRATWNAVEDVHDTRGSLGLGMQGQHPTWRSMSRVAMKLDGRTDWSDTSAVREYKETKLARTDGETFLTEVMPLPSTTVGEWPYLAPYDSREEYYAEVRPGRMELLRDFVSRYRPTYVFCHGKANWEFHKELFPGAYAPLLEGYMETARVGRSKVVLIPSFSAFDMHISRLGEIVDALIGMTGHHDRA